MSFPTRERGLKYFCYYTTNVRPWSFPTRERGLKFDVSINGENGIGRSPRGNVD